MRDLVRSNKFLSLYLDYVEDTESPRIFHIWSALSGISAALGRRVWYPFGIENIYPNQYVILTGPSGAKKSTAIKIMKNLLKQSTSIKFAPDDTAGQRQGLIMAMVNNVIDPQDDLTSDVLRAMTSEEGLAKLGDYALDTRDPYSLYAVASEFNSFIGEKSTSLATFLIKMWDGDEYTYTLKKEQVAIHDALIGMLGGTTPSQIAISMPAEAVGQGLTSRMLFVFGAQKYKQVPRPARLDATIGGQLMEYFSHAFNNMNGPVSETPEAASLMDHYAVTQINIKDPRFTGYMERRHTHLQKLATVLAVSDKRMEICVEDVVMGNAILAETEKGMPDALGEYGLNKLSAAKQKLVEFIRSCTEPVPVEIIFAMMSRDMTRGDCHTSINDLINAGTISQFKVGDRICVIARVQERAQLKEVMLGSNKL